MPDAIYGPLGALVILGIAVAALWRDHQRADADDRKQRDQNYDGWMAQTQANARLAEAWEQRNRDEAARRRRDD